MYDSFWSYLLHLLLLDIIRTEFIWNELQSPHRPFLPSFLVSRSFNSSLSLSHSIPSF